MCAVRSSTFTINGPKCKTLHFTYLKDWTSLSPGYLLLMSQVSDFVGGHFFSFMSSPIWEKKLAVVLI